VNVINIPFLKQLGKGIEELMADTSVRVLILRAEGKLFSAGVDVADHTDEKVGEMIPLFNKICCQLADFPVPTIAVVHGHALGGGCELVICCDFAVMAANAKIGQPEIQLAALAPIAALRLPHMIGYRATADILLTGRNLTAEEALDIGLINAVVALDEIEEWVDEKAAQLTSLSRAALMLNKRAIELGYESWARNLPDMEDLYLRDLMGTADAHEGLAAFMEKRPPEWKHE
jgi:cyclohexa-1,5-dienecarbonyl-CoA hydratase